MHAALKTRGTRFSRKKERIGFVTSPLVERHRPFVAGSGG
jgi:hypothetical protein